MFFSNWKVGARLAAGFSLVVLLLIAIAVIAVVQIRGLNQNVDTILHDRFAKVQLTTTIQHEIDMQARLVRNALIGIRNPEEVQAALSQTDASLQRVTVAIDALVATVASAEGKRLIAVVQDKRAAYARVRNAYLALLKEGRPEEAGVYLLKDVRAPQFEFFDAVQALTALQLKLMTDDGARARSEGQIAITMTVALSAVASLLAILMGVLLARSITRPLGQAVRVAETVAAGDLTSLIEVRTHDEMGQLLHSLKAMQDSLIGVVSTVRTGTHTIATASSQIAVGNQDLSSRTEEQASSLEQTAASMEELTSTVKQNAENARQANQLAASASDFAVKGGEVVGRVVDTMSAIETSSRKIVDIISVIDGIAFQTNILALNAAVEAARAGEQGRGFAVVASEVRNLAQRSAAAAKEIKGLIDASVGNVSAGTALVDEAGKTMGQIVDSVKRVTDIMGEITAASQEQTTGIEQINQAITQMDQVTQQNAALVEEAAAAASSLQEQAGGLVKTVSVFKLDAHRRHVGGTVRSFALGQKTTRTRRVEETSS